MGLLDFFRRRGSTGDEAETRAMTPAGWESPPDERAHGVGAPPGSAAEGPPVGVSDPGALSGEDAGEVVAGEEDVEIGGEDATRPTGA